MSTGPGNDASPQERDEREWSDEGLFARDLDGHLIRYDAATRGELDRDVTLEIDGQKVVVKKAVPATDEQGKLKCDGNGEVIPRPTTIYDAVTKRYEKPECVVAKTGAPASGGPNAENAFQRIASEGKNPIPVLCHTPYMEPVAVCRVCVVQLARFRRRTGQVEVDDKLLPACQHRVEDEMIVNTIASPDPNARHRIGTAVKTLVELLMADHPSPCTKERQNPGDCELEGMAKKLDVTKPRFERRAVEFPRDDSSLVIAVDHNACILCDRCVRGCDVIKENHVIGRMGKGYKARIAFDLDTPMGGSSCVACGECSDDCPTGALTHRRVIETKLPAGRNVDVPGLLKHEIPEIQRAFQGVSLAFLRSNIHAVKRRDFRKGEIIYNEGEYGSTAFFIENGSVEIYIRTPAQHVENQPRTGFLERGSERFTSRLIASRGSNAGLYPGRRPSVASLWPLASDDGQGRHLRRDDVHELLSAIGNRPRG